jgi:hypothetical protein
MEALPHGAIYVIHDESERQHCRRMLHQMGRDPMHALRLTTLDDFRYGRLRGASRDTIMAVDHAVYELATTMQLHELRP